jgi:hypothetical protein
MLGRLRKAFSGGTAVAETTIAPTEISVANAPALQLPQFLVQYENLPVLDGTRLAAWVNDNVAVESRDAMLDQAKRAWLLHLRDALGDGYQLEESATALVLSSLEPVRARTTANFLANAREQVLGVLHGIARAPQWGKDLMIVFEDADSYFRYLSLYFPDAAARGLSRAMYLRAGVGHFVAVKADLYAAQSLMVHEMTRNCLTHLPLPLWLNIGIAVNTERQLVHSKSCGGCGSGNMHDRLAAFWNETEMPGFWSGASFQRGGEAAELSFELARVMVELLAKDWQSFGSFAVNASADDAGSAAARTYLDIELGELVCALLERDYRAEWSPALV